MLAACGAAGWPGGICLNHLPMMLVGVVLRGLRVEVAGRAGAADVGAGDVGREALELARRAPEQVADELLRVDRAVRLLVGLEERDQARAADRDERAVDVGLELRGVGRVVGRVERRVHPLHDVAADRAELRAMKPAAEVQPKL